MVGPAFCLQHSAGGKGRDVPLGAAAAPAAHKYTDRSLALQYIRTAANLHPAPHRVHAQRQHRAKLLAALCIDPGRGKSGRWVAAAGRQQRVTGRRVGLAGQASNKHRGQGPCILLFQAGQSYSKQGCTARGSMRGRGRTWHGPQESPHVGGALPQGGQALHHQRQHLRGRGR